MDHALVSKIFAQFGSINRNLLRAVLHNLSCRMTAENVQLLFQTADSCFHCIFFNNLSQCIICDGQNILVNAGIRQGARHQIAL